MCVQVLIETPSDKLDVEGLRSRLNIEGCGSIISFVGVTRGIDDGRVINALEFETWEAKLHSILTTIGESAINKFDIKSVAISHRSGRVTPEQPIVAIHVASIHRAEGFEACSWLIETLKDQAPIWKLEDSHEGRRWVAGLG